MNLYFFITTYKILGFVYNITFRIDVLLLNLRSNLNLILIKYIGHAGLALATSISALVCIVLLFRSLRKKIGNFGEEKIAVVFIKTLISGVVMGIVTTIFYDFISNIVKDGMIGQIVSLSISVLVGVKVYFIGVVILKIDEVNQAISIIKDKFTTKRGEYSAK